MIRTPALEIYSKFEKEPGSRKEKNDIFEACQSKWKYARYIVLNEQLYYKFLPQSVLRVGWGAIDHYRFLGCVMSRKGILFGVNIKIDNKVKTSRILLRLIGKH